MVRIFLTYILEHALNTWVAVAECLNLLNQVVEACTAQHTFKTGVANGLVRQHSFSIKRRSSVSYDVDFAVVEYALYVIRYINGQVGP